MESFPIVPPAFYCISTTFVLFALIVRLAVSVVTPQRVYVCLAQKAECPSNKSKQVCIPLMETQ